jgi:hypothetical protein
MLVPLKDSEYVAFHCGSNETNIFIRQLFSPEAVSGYESLFFWIFIIIGDFTRLPLKEEGQLDITIYLQDALSYRHFQRTHPRTRQYFRDLEATGNFRVFEVTTIPCDSCCTYLLNSFEIITQWVRILFLIKFPCTGTTLGCSIRLK